MGTRATAHGTGPVLNWLPGGKLAYNSHNCPPPPPRRLDLHRPFFSPPPPHLAFPVLCPPPSRPLLPQASHVSPRPLCPRHTPHDADPVHPRPADRPLQLGSRPASPAPASACTRRQGNPARGGASGPGASPASTAQAQAQGRPAPRPGRPTRAACAPRESAARGAGGPEPATESGRLQGGRVWFEDGLEGLGLRPRAALPRDTERVWVAPAPDPAPGSAGSLPHASGRWRPASRLRGWSALWKALQDFEAAVAAAGSGGKTGAGAPLPSRSFSLVCARTGV